MKKLKSNVACAGKYLYDYFDIIALRLLPDHLHFVWKLPDGDCNYSLRWSRIKAGSQRGSVMRAESNILEAPLTGEETK